MVYQAGVKNRRNSQLSNEVHLTDSTNENQSNDKDNNEFKSERQEHPQNQPQHWKVFDRKTEAGRLLARLYGISSKIGMDAPIQYPKLKTRKSDLSTCQWKVGNNANHNPDSTVAAINSRIKAKSVHVPKVGKSRKSFGQSSYQNLALVDIIPKRKSVQKCREEILQTEERITAYRPPNRTCLAEVEKNRLNDIFTFKGGSALPTELTCPEGPMPEEVKWKEKEMERVEKAKARRRSKLYGEDKLASSNQVLALQKENRPDKTISEQLENQIVREIEERRIFQREMEDTDCGDKTRNTIAKEISSRIMQLKKLNPSKGDAIMRKTNNE